MDALLRGFSSKIAQCAAGAAIFLDPNASARNAIPASPARFIGRF